MTRRHRAVALLWLAVVAGAAGPGCAGARTIIRGQSPDSDAVVGVEAGAVAGQARSNSNTSAASPSARTVSAGSSLTAAPSPWRSG
jgi:hypothetical protein